MIPKGQRKMIGLGAGGFGTTKPDLHSSSAVITVVPHGFGLMHAQKNKQIPRVICQH